MLTLKRCCAEESNLSFKFWAYEFQVLVGFEIQSGKGSEKYTVKKKHFKMKSVHVKDWFLANCHLVDIHDFR